MSESSNTGFGLTALMNEIERTAKTSLGSTADTILGEPASCERVSLAEIPLPKSVASYKGLILCTLDFNGGPILIERQE